jgi:hypothetical protein
MMYKKLLLSSALLFSISAHASEEAEVATPECASCQKTPLHKKVGRKLMGHCPSCGKCIDDSLPQKAKHAAKSACKKAKDVSSNIASGVKHYFTDPCDECAKD